MPMLNFKNILITRTDRLGDVVLSTPVIKQLRDNFPNSKITFLTTPYTRDLVEGSPYIDDIIIYDKRNKHKSFFKGILSFSLYLRKKNFDAVFVLHPTNRMHIVTWLAGIPMRIGWNRKYGKLLTLALPHVKQEGAIHESEYNLELLKAIGLSASKPELYLPYKYIVQKNPFSDLEKHELYSEEKYLVFAMGASCLSKKWPVDSFVDLAQKFIEKYPDYKLLLLASESEKSLSVEFLDKYQGEVIDLTGKLTLAQIIVLFKNVSLFIGNDSGLSHIAAAMEVPLISLFARSDPGLSPKRWRPLGGKSKYIHKDVGCYVCKAHLCDKDFLCIKSITPQEVLELASTLVSSP